MVGEALADVGYHTETRCDGEGLEDVLEGLRPDLVVLDVMLPGRDGFDLINVIQAWGRHQHRIDHRPRRPARPAARS
ncbi:response regulator [Mycobacterium kansasii 732]|nr:response regulator [Mycobacterium kansasii 732]